MKMSFWTPKGFRKMDKNALIISKRLKFPQNDRTDKNIIAWLELNLQSFKSTPDSLKLRFRGSERKLPLGAPEGCLPFSQNVLIEPFEFAIPGSNKNLQNKWTPFKGTPRFSFQRSEQKLPFHLHTIPFPLCCLLSPSSCHYRLRKAVFGQTIR